MENNQKFIETMEQIQDQIKNELRETKGIHFIFDCFVYILKILKIPKNFKIP